MASSPFIQATEIHKSYQDTKGNQLNILRGVDLSVKQGETVSIMGASGAGKSTLLHLLGALDQPDSGVVQVDGMDLSTLTHETGAAFRNGSIGFVFQFHHLLNDFSAMENVMIPKWIGTGRTDDFKAEAMALLDEVGLADRAHHKPAQLSGGEQQRVAIARAIANRPPILLADEPTGNLDEDTGSRVQELLIKLNKKHNLTLILVTHNSHFAARMDHQYILEHGKLRPVNPHVHYA
ncbi:MAG: ABC transporter ATP-binding protein [Deltaproteobacteria bacterium]|nr:ABC transporter ATP-binding protein [Deltaproteobacteria bacterium]